jgi:vitamin B12 transporter
LIGDSFDDASNSVALDGYALVGLRASLPINDRLELYGRVDNIFDVQYTVVAGYKSFDRNAAVGVRAKF